jgi:2-methylaconitate cis-trans-isomerase PrpF
MVETSLPAVFMRGGTSKAVMFHSRDLPRDRAEWDAIFLGIMGSPDPNGRQLDGMGGGVSSLSKVCVLAPSTRADADIDYTFAQILIREPRVDYCANCGNMSSAVGPFAVDEGLLSPPGDTARVRIFNTNTQKLIHASFPVSNGKALYAGDLAIPGVAGTGAPIKLDFIEPGGATTGKLLPTGRVVDMLEVPGHGSIPASLVDAANATCFLRAADVGLTGLELPEALEADAKTMAKLMAIRIQASLAMGIAKSEEEAKATMAVPYIGIVRASTDSKILSGETLAAGSVDLIARVISSGQPHRALPLTVSLCTAVAARIAGTIVAEALSPAITSDGPIRIGMPSGALTVAADVARDAGGSWHASSGSFYRTARRLFDGRVYLPGR